MKRPILLVFWSLLFSSQIYSQNLISDAVKEMLDGKVTKFATKGHSKSKGAVFTIKIPASWVAKEGERPNILQKFESKNDNLLAMVMIITKSVPDDEPLTAADINETFSPSSLKELLPEDAKFISAQSTKIEGVPAGLIEYSARAERAGQSFESQTLTLYFFQGRTLVGVQFMLGGQKGGEVLRSQFIAYRPLFTMIMNSIVFDDMWVKGSDATQAPEENIFITHQDSQHLFSVVYPKTWKPVPISQPQTKFKVRRGNEFLDDFSVGVVSIASSENMTPKEFARSTITHDQIKSIRSYFPDAVLLDKGTDYLCNQEAVFFTYKATFRSAGVEVPITVMQWQTFRYGNVYTLTFRAETERFDTMRPTFQKILLGFMFLVKN